MRVVTATLTAALLLPMFDATAAAAAPACPPDDSRTSSTSDCRNSASHTEAPRDAAIDSSRNAPQSDTGRRSDATKRADAADDDDEDTCITKAANGVCLDEDED